MSKIEFKLKYQAKNELMSDAKKLREARTYLWYVLFGVNILVILFFVYKKDKRVKTV